MKLQIVVPCYNEQEVLAEAAAQLEVVLQRMIACGKVSSESGITFVDDGSRDRTWALIQETSRSSRYVAGLKLSRNRGHQNAVLAGLLTVEGDAVITMDADLQDDVDAIEAMVDAHHSGSDIVYGVRNDRASDSVFKRTTAELFYRLLARFGVELVHNHADFRLLSRRAIEALRQFREVNVFLRGMVPLIGFQSSAVEYGRRERFAGDSKYTLVKMVKLAVEGVTSLSTVPLQIITILSALVFAVALGMSGWVFWVALFTDHAVPGWASIVLPVLLLGGLQMMCIGVLGAYVGKVYSEVKARPRFVIEDAISGSHRSASSSADRSTSRATGDRLRDVSVAK